MFQSFQMPIIPIISLLIILPLVSWQVYSLFKQRALNRKPTIPELGKQKLNLKKNLVKNVTLLTDLKPKVQANRKASLVFTSAILVFVAANLIIVTYYLRNRKLTYLPRASQILTPTTISNLNPLDSTPTTRPTFLATANPTQTTALTPSAAPTPTIKPTQTVIPTAIVTLSPTAKPTLIAYGEDLFPTATPIPTKKPTPQPSLRDKGIPTAGIGMASGLLLMLSLIFLTVGFAL